MRSFSGSFPRAGTPGRRCRAASAGCLGSTWTCPSRTTPPRTGRLGLEKRRLQPDAILELPAFKKRFLIEYETGSATVRDAKKSTSTMAKLDRYGTFFCAPVGNV